MKRSSLAFGISQGLFSRLLAATLLLSAGPALAVSLEIKPEIEALEKTIEARIEHRLKVFLGEDARVLALVRVKEGAPKPAPKPTIAAVPAAAESVYGDLSLDAESLEGATLRRSRKLEIQSLEVDLQLSDEYDPATVEASKALVVQLLKGMDPKISVTRLAEPKRVASAQDAAEKQGAWKAWLPLLPFITAVGVAILLTFGISLIGMSLRKLGTTLVEGFRQVFTLNHLDGSGGGRGAQGKGGLQTLEVKTGPAGAPAISSALRDYPRNIRLVRKLALEAPMCISQVLGSQDADWRGMKWVLPALADPERQALKQCLGEARLRQISDAQGAQTQEDLTAWLQGFAERLALKQIQGGNAVEKALGTERSNSLSAISRRRVVDFTRASEDPAVWRISTEFLPQEEMEKLVREGGSKAWEALIRAAELDPQALAATADRVIAELSHLPSDDLKEQAKTEYFSRKLVDLAIGNILDRKLSDEDAFLDELEGKDSRLAALVREKYWTARYLERVPRAYLEPMFRNLHTEQKLSLLWAMPESGAKLLESFVPVGNARTILLDQLSKVRKSEDRARLKAAEAVCRQFMDFLRKQHSEGKFELEGAAPGVAMTEESEREAA